MPRRPPCRKALCAAATPLRGRCRGLGTCYPLPRYAAQTLELTGWVENEDDGRLCTLEVQGDPESSCRCSP